MGYSSEVVFACSYKDYLSLNEQMKEKGFDLLEDTSDHDKFEYEGKPWIWLKWNYLKWYPEYNDIKILVKYMKNFNNKYQFMRLGESSEDEPDVINTTDDEDWFSVSRSIEVNI